MFTKRREKLGQGVRKHNFSNSPGGIQQNGQAKGHQSRLQNSDVHFVGFNIVRVGVVSAAVMKFEGLLQVDFDAVQQIVVVGASNQHFDSGWTSLELQQHDDPPSSPVGLNTFDELAAAAPDEFYRRIKISLPRHF